MNWKDVDQNVRVLLFILLSIVLLIGSSCNSASENVIDEAQITLTPEIDVTPLSDELVVKVDVANLRSGPGVEFESTGMLNKEDTVVIDGVSATGSWYRITDGGWIAADFVEPVADEVSATATSTTDAVSPESPTLTPTVAPPTPTTTGTPTPEQMMEPTTQQTPNATITPVDSTIKCRTATDVFLLSGPGSSAVYHIRGSLFAGEEVQVLGGNRKDGNHTHYKVRADNGDQGWLQTDSCPVDGDSSIDFVAYPLPFTSTASPTPLPPDTPIPTATIVPPTPPDAPTSTATGTPAPEPTVAPPTPPDTPTGTPAGSVGEVEEECFYG